MTDQTYYTVLILGLVLYAFACVIAGAYISTEKRRSAGEGAIFGLLFGPLGLIVAACMPDRPVPPAASEPGTSLTAAEQERVAREMRNPGAPGQSAAKHVPEAPRRRLLGEIDEAGRPKR